MTKVVIYVITSLSEGTVEKKKCFFLCFLPLCPSQGTLERTIRQYIRKCNHYKVTPLLVVPLNM